RQARRLVGRRRQADRRRRRGGADERHRRAAGGEKQHAENERRTERSGQPPRCREGWGRTRDSVSSCSDHAGYPAQLNVRRKKRRIRAPGRSSVSPQARANGGASPDGIGTSIARGHSGSVESPVSKSIHASSVPGGGGTV